MFRRIFRLFWVPYFSVISLRSSTYYNQAALPKMITLARYLCELVLIPFSGLHSVHLKLRWPPVIASARSRRICRWRKWLYTMYTIYNKGNVGNNCLSLVTLGLPPIWYIRIKRKWSLLLISLDKRVLSTYACVVLDVNCFIVFSFFNYYYLSL